MVLQVLLNTMVTGATYALVAIGFSLIYNSARFFHFSHGAVFMSAAYATWLLGSVAGLPLVLAIPVAVVFAALLGVFLDVVVYRPLRNRQANPLVLLMASLGTYVVLQNLVSLLFGDGVKTFRGRQVSEGYIFLEMRITPTQIAILLTAVILFVVVALVLTLTRAGRALRAVANNPQLALVSGINSQRTILFAFAGGSALAGVAGILVACDVNMTPTMGLNPLLMGVVAVIIGGVRSVPGIALGALLLGMAQHLGVWVIGSQWQDAIAFVILLAFLLVRPQGFLGKKLKTATV